jgi:hypothetical protein
MFKLEIILLVSFLFCSCSKGIELSETEDTSNKSSAFPSPMVLANANITSSSKMEPTIQFENNYCIGFGSCTNYKVSIYSNGEVIFEGLKGVKKIGIVKSKITKSKLEELIGNFEDIDFFRLSDKYVPGKNCSGSVISDSNTVQIYYNDGKLSKNISHYRGCLGTKKLNKLLELEESIDRVVNTKQWIS